MDTLGKEVFVLLVDDDETCAEIIHEHLGAADTARFHLEWADTPGKARTLLQSESYDVVLLDYYLPGCTGIDLLDDLPDLTVQAPVIVLTGRPEKHLDTEALRRGVFDFLDKSHLSADILERTIRYALRQFRIQRALRENKEQFEDLFNAVFEGIVVHDGRHILHANPAFGHLMGCDPENVAGVKISAVFGETPILRETSWPGRMTPSSEIELINQRGEHLILEIRSRNHLFNGRPAFLLAVRDITPHKQIAAQLCRVNEELEMRVEQRTEALRRSNQDLERFAYVIAHDMRTPLRTVHDYLNEARRAMEPNPAHPEDVLRQHFLNSALLTVEHLRALVQAVLDYSRVSIRETTLERVSLDEVLREVLIHLDAEFNRAGAEIRIPPLPNVRGNRLLLCDLFRNLLHNAVKYRGEEPLIVSMAINELETFWQFAVHDNGVGFHPEESEDIFVVLHRGSNANGKPGDGMGLALCKKIVELHGGQIWARAAPGEGAGFFFTLPKSETPQTNRPNDRGTTYEDHCRCG